MSTKWRSFLALWGWPIVLGALTASGLATALVSDTWGDWWSWVGLGVPVAVMSWFSRPRARLSIPQRHAGSAAPAPPDVEAPDRAHPTQP